MTNYIEKCIHDKNLLISMRSRSMDLINKDAPKKVYEKINETISNNNIKFFSGKKIRKILKTGIIIQARMGSKRLPGKVMKKIHESQCC